MKNLIKWLSDKQWIYKLAVKLIATRIVHDPNRLTPEHLKNKGWIQEGKYWVEPNIKDRDKIWINFGNHYYRVWHGGDRTFIALESSLEWFENYYLLAHGENGRYDLAGVLHYAQLKNIQTVHEGKTVRRIITPLESQIDTL